MQQMLLENTVKGIFGLFLVCKTIEDIRKRTVGIYFIILITVGLITANIVFGLTRINEMILGGIVGVVFLMISKLTKQSIGYGDTAIVTSIGLGFGMIRQIQILMVATTILFVVSLVLLVSHKIKLKDSLPFVPFLLAGYVITVVV